MLTIREAAWLTDNAYKYEEVARATGEIVILLKGNLRVNLIAVAGIVYSPVLHIIVLMLF